MAAGAAVYRNGIFGIRSGLRKGVSYRRIRVFPIPASYALTAPGSRMVTGQLGGPAESADFALCTPPGRQNARLGGGAGSRFPVEAETRAAKPPDFR